MLVVDGLTHLAEDLLPYHAEDAGGRWAGELSEWKGDFEMFHETWMAVLQLRQTDQSIKASESGRKGGKGVRKHEVKDHIIPPQPTQSHPLMYLGGNHHNYKGT